jgi:hypothetical protein
VEERFIHAATSKLSQGRLLTPWNTMTPRRCSAMAEAFPTTPWARANRSTGGQLAAPSTFNDVEVADEVAAANPVPITPHHRRDRGRS